MPANGGIAPLPCAPIFFRATKAARAGFRAASFDSFGYACFAAFFPFSIMYHIEPESSTDE